MRVAELTKEQIAEVYNKSMLVDFPAAERKPLAMIIKSYEAGTYECLGAFEGDDIIGYAFFVKTGNDYLFDYFATFEHRRNSGVGTEFLACIAEHFKDASSVIGEVEDPACATAEEDRVLQERRLNFYLRNGYAETGVRVKLFGVDYIVLELADGVNRMPHSSEEIEVLYKKQYRAILSLVLYKMMVRIKKR